MNYVHYSQICKITKMIVKKKAKKKKKKKKTKGYLFSKHIICHVLVLKQNTFSNTKSICLSPKQLQGKKLSFWSFSESGLEIIYV